MPSNAKKTRVLKDRSNTDLTAADPAAPNSKDGTWVQKAQPLGCMQDKREAPTRQQASLLLLRLVFAYRQDTLAVSTDNKRMQQQRRTSATDGLCAVKRVALLSQRKRRCDCCIARFIEPAVRLTVS